MARTAHSPSRACSAAMAAVRRCQLSVSSPISTAKCFFMRRRLRALVDANGESVAA